MKTESIQLTRRRGSLVTRHSSLVTSKWVEEAQHYLVGGVNSPVRSFRQIGAEPLMLVRAQGAEAHDAAGGTWLDFIMGWGSLILGHRHPAVTRALRQALPSGTLMGLTHPAEVELARLITEAVPSVEQLRFTVSGTEACMIAVRLARAQTGRTTILTVDGCYHGHSDSLIARKSPGIPEALVRDTLTVPWSDLEAVEAVMQRAGETLACVIIEPVAANIGVVTPAPGFLARLRELTRRHGVLLIFDEVVTGFRLGLGGAQGRYGVTPDLTIFGKIIGGGLPSGAVGGPRRLMQRLAPEGEVFHGGTFAGHPLSMIAGISTLKELSAHPPYERLERMTERLVGGLSDAASRVGVNIQINWAGSMLTVFFAETPVRNFAEVQASHRQRFAQWAQALRQRGILIPPSPFEALFLSSAHTPAHVDRFIRAAREAFQSMVPPPVAKASLGPPGRAPGGGMPSPAFGPQGRQTRSDHARSPAALRLVALAQGRGERSRTTARAGR